MQHDGEAPRQGDFSLSRATAANDAKRPGRGDNSPIFARAIQRIALDTATPNRAAAERADASSADAFNTRDRKSSPSALAIVHLLQGEP